jgi:hypothetical protein
LLGGLAMTAASTEPAILHVAPGTTGHVLAAGARDHVVAPEVRFAAVGRADAEANVERPAVGLGEREPGGAPALERRGGRIP